MSDMANMTNMSGMSAARLVHQMSIESALSGFIPSVLMCAACGIEPAESRDVSVVALCEGCAASLFMAYMSELREEPGSSDMSTAEQYRTVYARLTDRFGYEMMDAALAEYFD